MQFPIKCCQSLQNKWKSLRKNPQNSISRSTHWWVYSACAYNFSVIRSSQSYTHTQTCVMRSLSIFFPISTESSKHKHWKRKKRKRRKRRRRTEKEKSWKRSDILCGSKKRNKNHIFSVISVLYAFGLFIARERLRAYIYILSKYIIYSVHILFCIFVCAHCARKCKRRISFFFGLLYPHLLL